MTSRWRPGLVLLAVSGGFALFGLLGAGGPEPIGNIHLDRTSTTNNVPAVIFPHWKHRIRFRCLACHPDVFEMKAETTDISMDALRAGELCARCHNGKTAFAVGFDTCRTCHSGSEQ